MSNEPKTFNDGFRPVEKGHTPKQTSSSGTSGNVQGGHTPTTSNLPGTPPKK